MSTTVPVLADASSSATGVPAGSGCCRRCVPVNMSYTTECRNINVEIRTHSLAADGSTPDPRVDALCTTASHQVASSSVSWSLPLTMGGRAILHAVPDDMPRSLH